MFGAFVPVTLKKDGKKRPPTKDELKKIEKEKSAAKSDSVASLWANYKSFKKAHKMLTW